ncbi:TonB-dependent receptor [Filimonas lacunae]|nr:TonB-dependent receptor [Filimonas lacunae]
MKLTIVFLLAGMLQLHARGFSQQVSIHVKDASLEEVFAAIKKQTGYTFLYTYPMLQKAGKVDMALSNVSLKQALDECFKNQPLVYNIVDNAVIVKVKEVQQQQVLQAAFQPPVVSAVSGNVTDDKGNLVEGASVVIKELNLNTQTNNKGAFSFADIAEGTYTVEVTMIGFKKQERKLTVKGKQVIVSFVLVTQQNQLDETVVIAYGTTTKRYNTSSVGTVKAEVIQSQPIDNPLNALQGRIAGLQLTQGNGIPGSQTTVQIRGRTSLDISTTGNMPLYVIDGVTFSGFNGGQPASDNLALNGTTTSAGAISPFYNINPNDIERIDVLKDADATAIYGARGSNGVILITTKKGRAGTTKLDANVSSGAGKVGRFVPMMDIHQYLQMRREAFANAGTTPTATNAPDLLVWDSTKTTDWQKYLIGGSAAMTSANATVSGGNGGTRFLFNSNYTHNGTVFQGDFHSNRFSNRLNLDHTTRDQKLNISMDISYSTDNTILPMYDAGSNFYNLPPNYPMYASTGSLYWAPVTYASTNPKAYEAKVNESKTTNLLANFSLKYNIYKSLFFKVTGGYNVVTLNQNGRQPMSSYNPASTTTGRSVFTNNRNETLVAEPQLEYTTKVWKGKLQALVGSTFQKATSSGSSITGTGYTNDALLTSLISAAAFAVSSNTNYIYKFNSGFGRLNYNILGKYIVNATFRRDGSSRFGANYAHGNFGAGGAAWIFSEEKFVKQALPLLSFGKLRGSFGITGNDQIPNYKYMTLYNVAGSGYNYQGGVVTYPTVSSVYPNNDLRWESNKKAELGLELGFIENRIVFNATYYRNVASNQLLNVNLPAQVGTDSYLGNFPATVVNQGWELELNTTNIRKKDFEWTSSFNISITKNRLTKFPGLKGSSYESSYAIGQPADLIWIYNYLGVDPQTGGYRFEDKNSDGTINYVSDRQYAKVGTPYFGGLNNTFTYKGFQLGFFFQFAHRYGYTNNIIGPIGGSMYNQNTSVVNRWQKEGDNTVLGKATTSTSGPGGLNASLINTSTAFWGDASFLRFKNINLTYQLPQLWIQKLKMSSCSIYVQVQNVYTWSKQKYLLDPETSIVGAAPGLGAGTMAVPPLRTMVAGIRCSF